jgi:hypothetical protein
MLGTLIGNTQSVMNGLWDKKNHQFIHITSALAWEQIFILKHPYLSPQLVSTPICGGSGEYRSIYPHIHRLYYDYY